MNRTLRETILWIGAGLGTLCLAWTAAMLVFGLTPLVFTSGSMSPAIKAGDLAFATTVPADELAEGDVVSVIDDRGVRITHRVTGIDPQDDGGAVLQLKGDANASPDEQAYNVDEVERVSFSVPKAGYVVNAVNSPFGMFVIGLLAATALFLAFGGRARGRDGGGNGADRETPSVDPGTETDSGDDPGARRDRRLILIGPLAFVLGIAGALVSVQSAQAAFADTATATSGSSSSRTLASVPAVGCTGSGGTSVTLSWTDLGPLYEYVVVARDSDNGVYSTQTVRGNGTTVSAVIERRTSITYTAYEHRVTVTPRLISSTSWVAPSTDRSIWERYNLVPGLNNRVFCSAP